jgi:cadmium resistance protein CadD (predicted permease)
MKDVTKQECRNGLTFPLILILVGLAFFAQRIGFIDRHTLFQFLPLVPVAIGCSLLFARLRRRAGQD